MSDFGCWMLVKTSAKRILNQHPKSNIQHLLFSYLPLHTIYDLLRQRRGDFLVFTEMHRKTSAPLRIRANIGGITEHLRQRHHRLDDLRGAPQLHALEAAAARVDIADHRAHGILRTHYLNTPDRV